MGLLLLVLVALPFAIAYFTLLRLTVEFVWGVRGRRILLVYSRSPVWQDYIESTWLPRLKDKVVILNLSDRQNWATTSPFAAWVFRKWAPSENFNPMVILFPAFRSARCIGFYDAFRDAKHGKEQPLRSAESELFEFCNKM